MKITSRCLVAGLLSVSFVYAGPVSAQNYPVKPIRIIVPYSPGGSTDVVMRILAPRMMENLGQQVVVENRPGGSSTIGLDVAAKSAPDGYTLGVPNLTFGANPSLIKKMPFDTEKDLVPVSLVSIVTLVLTVHPSIPARSVKELIALAKSKPGSLNYGSAGNASANHLATERFNYMTGTKMVHIPFKGGGPAVISIVSGETAILMATIPSSIQHFETGRLRPLGVTSLQRNAALPKIPSINEAGVPGYEAIEWNGIVVPAGTPQAVITRLNQAIVKSLSIPEVKQRILDLGADPVGNSPEEFAAFIKKEIATWTKVIKEVGITVE
ncbi:MAG: tripartite tricarboxylate transporter substrate binding protein [Betaproteobacteria bacterium]|nr:tripartite tricarboxylate transporter substrate binding protein [Betaproteobacteria bacterium]